MSKTVKFTDAKPAYGEASNAQLLNRLVAKLDFWEKNLVTHLGVSEEHDRKLNAELSMIYGVRCVIGVAE
jgi:hypothetical protein